MKMAIFTYNVGHACVLTWDLAEYLSEKLGNKNFPIIATKLFANMNLDIRCEYLGNIADDELRTKAYAAQFG